jgi:hypothetical protein
VEPRPVPGGAKLSRDVRDRFLVPAPTRRARAAVSPGHRRKRDEMSSQAARRHGAGEGVGAGGTWAGAGFSLGRTLGTCKEQGSNPERESEASHVSRTTARPTES